MKTHVLCVDDNRLRLISRRKSLEADGFIVLPAYDETQAVNLLKSQRVDVVCVDSAFLERGGSGVGANFKSVGPDVPIVLIRENGAVPVSMQEHVDVVIDGADFDAGVRSLIEGMLGVKHSFFLQWLDAWMHHASKPVKDASLRH